MLLVRRDLSVLRPCWDQDIKESGPTEKHSSEPAGSALTGATPVISGGSHGPFTVTALGEHNSEESPGTFFSSF